MPGDPRPWEQRNVRDRELSPSVSIAITFSFLLAAMMTMVVVGFTPTGFVIGSGVGIVLIVLLSKLAARSQRPARRSPPRDLL